jgi:hypothetical protein
VCENAEMTNAATSASRKIGSCSAAARLSKSENSNISHMRESEVVGSKSQMGRLRRMFMTSMPMTEASCFQSAWRDALSTSLNSFVPVLPRANSVPDSS